MGTIATKSTLSGGVTPACNKCGIHLCWDISDVEYQADRSFWDAWICQDCNDGVPMSRKAFHPSAEATNGQTSAPAMKAEAGGQSLRSWLASIGESPESIDRDIAVCKEHPETRAYLIALAKADMARKNKEQKNEKNGQ